MIDDSFYEMLGLAFIMGFSIFLSFPIMLRKKTSPKTTILLVSFAVGILIFLIGDIFSDVASQLYVSGSYVANPLSTLIFIASVGGLYGFLYFIENPRKLSSSNVPFVPKKVALIVAIGMGLQNLTEGLVFGYAYVVGLTGLFLVILTGFILQNFTEGFPIVSPFIGVERPNMAYIAGLYFIGGFPTIAGSLIGYHYANPSLNIIFDGLAIGAIIYVLIPMSRNLFRQADLARVQSLIYSGVIAGFIIGFAVNAI